jgi:hypothetical protein
LREEALESRGEAEKKRRERSREQEQVAAREKIERK